MEFRTRRQALKLMLVRLFPFHSGADPAGPCRSRKARLTTLERVEKPREFSQLAPKDLLLKVLPGWRCQIVPQLRLMLGSRSHTVPTCYLLISGSVPSVPPVPTGRF